ncbi:MAG: hypothetical protein C5B58_05285 [Acidobacteria bacterium]|nr:MAG: hypothetical protein C5B58_05285 [Acidobacteriota bacterium]
MKKLVSIGGYLFIIFAGLLGTFMVYHMWQLSQPGRGHPTLREPPWQAKVYTDGSTESLPSPSAGLSHSASGE